MIRVVARCDAAAVTDPSDDPLAAAPFSFRETRGRVLIAFRGKTVTTLAGAAAARFMDRVAGATPRDAQLVMAKATGHFKRGNERSGKSRR